MALKFTPEELETACYDYFTATTEPSKEGLLRALEIDTSTWAEYETHEDYTRITQKVENTINPTNHDTTA